MGFQAIPPYKPRILLHMRIERLSSIPHGIRQDNLRDIDHLGLVERHL